MAKIVMPTTDLGFKKILASNEHKTITQGFIADFFGLHVKLDDIHIVNPYSIQPMTASGTDAPQKKLRETLRDITVEIAGADVTIEMQMLREPNYTKRALYYLAELYTSNYNPESKQHRNHRRDHYATLRPTWSMNVLGEQVFDCQHSYHMFTLHDPNLNETLIPELIRFGFYELTKPDTVPQIARWRDFLLTGRAADTAPAYLKEAASIIEYVNLSPEERHMVDLHEKYIADRDASLYWAEQSGIDQGIQQGIQQGIDQGIRENQLVTARAALRLRIPHDQITEITGLDAATVNQLADELASAPTSP